MPMYTDEGKMSQILRNFISNALKFTESGEVRDRRGVDEATGEHECCFRSPTRASASPRRISSASSRSSSRSTHPLQKRVKGTGLGLPLCRKLAELLGGHVWVESEVGVGSTFSAAVPITSEPRRPVEDLPFSWEADGRDPILVLEDAYPTSCFTRRFSRTRGITPIRRAPSAPLARSCAAPGPRPSCLMSCSTVKTRGSFSARSNQPPRHAPFRWSWLPRWTMRARGSHWEQMSMPPSRSRNGGFHHAGYAAGQSHRHTKVLVVDDQDAARYIVRQFLRDPAYPSSRPGAGPKASTGRAMRTPT